MLKMQCNSAIKTKFRFELSVQLNQLIDFKKNTGINVEKCK